MTNNRILSRSYFFILLFTLGAIAVFFISRNKSDVQRGEGVVWATEYHIAYEGASNLLDSVIPTLMKVDNSVSMFNEHSLVTRINNNETDVVDEVFAMLYKRSRQVNTATSGAYDPTVAPLVNAWGFGYKSGNLPDSAAVDSILKFVGIESTRLNGIRLVKNDARTKFDFSSIAKGFGCDVVAQMLERNGVTDYLVEIGGEVALRGHNDKGEAWRVSVDNPDESADSVVHSNALVLQLTSGGMATSGNYRNYKVINGKKYAHIVDPRTGYSSLSNLLSVTVVAGDCATADAFATGLMVLGLDDAKRYALTSDMGIMLISAREDGSYEKWWNKPFEGLIYKK